MECNLRDVGNNYNLELAQLGESSLGACIQHSDCAQVDAEDVLGRSPLMYAAMRGSQEAFEALVLAGAHQSAVDNAGNTFLHYACTLVRTSQLPPASCLLPPASCLCSTTAFRSAHSTHPTYRD